MLDFESAFRQSPVFVDTTSPELLNASRSGHLAAWEELVSKYAPLVYSWARLSNLSPEDAQDIVQDVMRSIYTGLDNFDENREHASFRGWLRTITKYKVVDFYRRKTVEPHGLGGTDAQRQMAAMWDLDESLSQLRFTESAEEAKSSSFNNLGKLKNLLARVRAEYSDRTWRAFWGMAVEDRKSSELAAELQMSPAAVRLAKSRVVRRLRDELNS